MRATAEPAILFSLSPDMDWQERASCAGVGPGAFFPDEGSSTRAAKKVCDGCPVRPECLAYALAHDERFGVWGGTTPRERRRLGCGQDPRPAVPAGMCRRGLHVMAGPNLALNQDGRRRCLSCRRAGEAGRNARRRAARSGTEGA
jgi:WhiB family redox-sensing transcriptional regulator